MRTYASIKPAFWTGATGRELRGDPDAQVVALYLISSPHCNLIGLYHLPQLYLVAETGLDEAVALRAFRRLADLGFCRYDAEAETVYVPRLAYHQVGPVLKPGDNRVKSIQRVLRQYAGHSFAREFFEAYREPYGLTLDADLRARWDVSPEKEEHPEEGGREPLGRGSEPPPSCPVLSCSCSCSCPAPEKECRVQLVWETYREIRKGTDWPPARVLTDDRKTSIAKSIDQIGHAQVLAGLKAAAESPFLTDPAVRNANPDHKTWRPDFDWLLRPDKLTRILEGAYSSGEDATPRTGDTPERRAAAASALGCSPEALRYDSSDDDYVLRSGGA